MNKDQSYNGGFMENSNNTNIYWFVDLILKYVYAASVSAFSFVLALFWFSELFFKITFSLLHVFCILPAALKKQMRSSSQDVQRQHLCSAASVKERSARVTSFPVNRSKCYAVLWVPPCARGVFQLPCMFCFIVSHSSLARFTTLEQHDKRLERSRKVIVTPDDLPRGTWKLTLAEKELPLMWKLEPKTVINLKHVWFCSHDWDDKSNKWKAESQRFKKEKLDLVLVAKQKKDQPLGEKWDSCRENLELRKGSFLPQLGAVL